MLFIRDDYWIEYLWTRLNEWRIVRIHICDYLLLVHQYSMKREIFNFQFSIPVVNYAMISFVTFLFWEGMYVVYFSCL